ncbi:MAG: B12-binding domain-containing radical SAM protein, partial [Terriglobia bacterium]
VNRYQPDMFWIADDVFTIHPGWLDQYATEMKRHALKLPFECISRADRLNPHVMDTLAELGCFRIWIGSESGSQRVLDAMQRGVTVEQVRTAVALAKSRRIKTGMFLMWGYEGEDLDDIEATIEHVKRSDPDIFFTTVSYPIKGTPYFNEISLRLVSPKPWAGSSDRDYQIRGRHSRRFYQYADQLLRSEVELSHLMGSAPAPDGETSKRIASLDHSLGAPDPSSVSEVEKRILQAREGLRASFSEVEA